MTARLRGLPPRGALLVAVALVAATVGVVFHATRALSALERSAVDARFGIRGARGPGHGIVLVGLDQKSLAELNVRPPIPRRTYARLLDRLHSAGARLVAIDVQFIGASDPRDDRVLVDAVARDGPVVLGTHDIRSGPLPVPAGRRSARGAIPASVAVDADSDGVVRRMLYEPVGLKTLAVRAAELLAGRPMDQDGFPGNHAWINFRGPPGTFPSHSLVDVVDGRVPASALRGRTVLVGITDPGERDVFVTSASSMPMSGVELHANALSTILDGFPLTSASGGAAVLLLLLLAAVPPLLAWRLPALYVLAASLASLLLFLVATQLAFAAGTIVPVATPILVLGLATAGASGVDFLTERRRRQALETALAGLPGDQSDFFISYRREESSWPARILKGELAKRFGEGSVFMDLDSIAAGQDWSRRIEEAVGCCNVLLVLIGPGWPEARDHAGRRRLDDPQDWVRLEIEAGLRRDTVVVVPVLLDGARMPQETDVPASIRPLLRRNAVALTAADWDSDVEDLLRSIRMGRLQDFAWGRRTGAAVTEPPP